MKRDKNLLDKRREYVKKRIWKARHSTEEVRNLSKQLFLSEQTIWNDLKH